MKSHHTTDTWIGSTEQCIRFDSWTAMFDSCLYLILFCELPEGISILKPMLSHGGYMCRQHYLYLGLGGSSFCLLNTMEKPMFFQRCSLGAT